MDDVCFESDCGADRHVCAVMYSPFGSPVLDPLLVRLECSFSIHCFVLL